MCTEYLNSEVVVMESAEDGDVCVPKTLSQFIERQNRLNWRDDSAGLLRSGRAGLAVQIEDPA